MKLCRSGQDISLPASRLYQYVSIGSENTQEKHKKLCFDTEDVSSVSVRGFVIPVLFRIALFYRTRSSIMWQISVLARCYIPEDSSRHNQRWGT